MIVVNAANIKKDFDWMVGHSAGYDVKIEDKSELISK